MSTIFSPYVVNLSNVAAPASSGTTNVDWTAFTPVASYVTNATWTGFYQHVNNTLNCIIYGAFTGATDAGALTFTLPSGFQLDSASVAGQSVPGGGNGFDASAFRGPFSLLQLSRTTVQAQYNTGASTQTGMLNNAPFTIANGCGLTFWINAKVTRV